MDATLEFVDYVRRVHERQLYETDFQALASKLGYRVRPSLSTWSYYGHPPTIGIRPWMRGPRRNRTGMHEISHLLMQECGVEEHLIAYHGGVEEAMPHIEWLAEYGVSLMLMPDPLVEQVLQESDLSAVAVASLYERTSATMGEALRRIVFHNAEAHCVGFIATGRFVLDVAVMNIWLPFWRYGQLRDVDVENADWTQMGRKAVGLYAY